MNQQFTTLWQQAQAQAHAGQPALAAQSLQTLLAQQPNHAEAAHWLAWLLHDQGEFATAYRWARQALALGATPERRLQVGWLLQCQGRYQEALVTYEKLLVSADATESQPNLEPAFDPIEARATAYLANCLAHLQRHAEAKLRLQSGLLRHPTNPHLVLELACLNRAMGTPQGALVDLQNLLNSAELQPHLKARAWHLVGLLRQDAGELLAADKAFETAHSIDPTLADAAWGRAAVQHKLGNAQAAISLLGSCLHTQPEHGAAHVLLAELELAEGQVTAARQRQRLVLPLRAKPHAARNNADAAAMWCGLSHIQAHQGRFGAAVRSARLAARLQPNERFYWRAVLCHWLAWAETAILPISQSLLDAARHAHWLASQARDANGIALAARTLVVCGDWQTARLWAEEALAINPATPWAWCVLGQISMAHRRWSEAADAGLRAVEADPQLSAAWQVLMQAHLGQNNPVEVREVWLRAKSQGVDSPEMVLLAAQALRLMGGHEAALAELTEAMSSIDGIDDSKLNQVHRARLLALTAQVMVELDPARAEAAYQICVDLLGDSLNKSEGLKLAVWLLQTGQCMAQDILAKVQAEELSPIFLEALNAAVTTTGARAFLRLSNAAAMLMPKDSWFGCAQLYAAALADEASPEALLKLSKKWFEQISDETAPATPNLRPHRSVKKAARPRLAYVITQSWHVPLIDRVLAAHDPGEVEVHVFAHSAWAGLPAHVRLHGPDPSRYKQVCGAYQIDAVIDVGGLQPYAQQYGVMKTLAERLAPLQVGWIGTLMSGGGLFDVLLADDVSVPTGEEVNYFERVERLAGGQWCWSPPRFAPTVAPAPCMTNGYVTVGVVGRSLRQGDEFLRTLAGVLAGNEAIQARFIGEVWGDWYQRQIITTQLRLLGVSEQRVQYHAQTSREGYWQWLSRVDLILDTCPASSGLSLLDALWMGVPVLTHPGRVLGARQAASVLVQIGMAQCVAKNADNLTNLALIFSGDVAGLQKTRTQLRQRIENSPLVDGARIARQIEALAKNWRMTKSAK